MSERSSSQNKKHHENQKSKIHHINDAKVTGEALLHSVTLCMVQGIAVDFHQGTVL